MFFFTCGKKENLFPNVTLVQFPFGDQHIKLTNTGHFLVVSLTCCQVMELFFQSFAIDIFYKQISVAFTTFPVNSWSISSLSCARGPGRCYRIRCLLYIYGVIPFPDYAYIQINNKANPISSGINSEVFDI